MKFLDPPLGVSTFEITSVWGNIETLVIVFVWQRYLAFIMRGRKGLSLNVYFWRANIPPCVFVIIEN